MKRVFYVFHWLNFDTALGAIITSLFIAQNLKIEMPAIAMVALFMTVLSIYNFDHLLDAQHIKGIAISGRHRFYQKHFRLLSIYQILLLIVLLFISWFVPTIILQAGVILALIALVYFLLLFIILPNKFLFKEVIISLVYVCGLILAPVMLSNLSFSITNYLLFIEILILAFSNTVILSWFDYSLDVKEGHVSFVRIIGVAQGYKLSLMLLALLGVLVAISLKLRANVESQVIILAMGLTLLLMLFFNSRLRKSEAFRVVGDAIFFIPLISLLY